MVCLCFFALMSVKCGYFYVPNRSGRHVHVDNRHSSVTRTAFKVFTNKMNSISFQTGDVYLTGAAVYCLYVLQQFTTKFHTASCTHTHTASADFKLNTNSKIKV